MITEKDQDELFSLISSKLRKDIVCYAFGGTAMIYYGYKDSTKDIDLLFENEDDRAEFIRVIEEIGFKEASPIKIYALKKLAEKKNKPLMYVKEDARFDLFSKTIFKTILSPKMKEDKYSVQEYNLKKRLTVNVARKEHIAFLKAMTERDRDFEDIVTITKKDKDFDWDYFVEEAAWQAENGNDWALLDAEKMMEELKEYVFIPEKHFKVLYEAGRK